MGTGLEILIDQPSVIPFNRKNYQNHKCRKDIHLGIQYRREEAVLVLRTILFNGRLLPCLIDNQREGLENRGELHGHGINTIGLEPQIVIDKQSVGTSQQPPAQGIGQKGQRISDHLTIDLGVGKIISEIPLQDSQLAFDNTHRKESRQDIGIKDTQHPAIQANDKQATENNRQERRQNTYINEIDILPQPSNDLNINLVKHEYNGQGYNPG